MSRPSVIITSTIDVAAVLRGDREAAGLTGEVLDEIIGWPDRYTAKAENPNKPWGRTALRMGDLFDVWAKGLNRSLVLMDRDQAERIVRAQAESSATPQQGLERRLIMRVAIG